MAQSPFTSNEEGKLVLEDNPFCDVQSIFDFIERLLVPLGKRIDATQPYLDGRLADGSRFHIIMPPIAPEGPHISIRKFRTSGAGSLTGFGENAALEPLAELVRLKRNVIISGGTGSGKTTLLSLLLDQAGSEERLAIIEEVFGNPDSASPCRTARIENAGAGKCR